MNVMRKSRVGLAVAAALGVACLAPATSFGWSVNTANGFLDTDSGGDTLLFPVYTTAVGAKTSFSVTNTNGQTIAAKIRFREQEHSMDVLDFVVVLSPYDKFDFWVAQGADDSGPVMHWNDNSCVVGPASSGEQAFPSASSNAFVETDEQMAVGHVEVLGMADLTGICVEADGSDATACTAVAAAPRDLAAAAFHETDGVPPDCSLLVDTLASQDNVEDVIAALVAEGTGDVDNELVGRYVITANDAGIEGGGDAIAIQDSDLGLFAHSGSECVANCLNNIVAVPGTVPLYAWDEAEWSHPHLGEMAFLAGFQQALTAQFVTGDWSNNPANNVGVDWVVSFPTKYAYLDYIPADDCVGGSGSSEDWCLLAETNTTFGEPFVWTAENTPNLCLEDNELFVADTEEQTASGSVTVSPGTETQLDICNEMNVLTMAAEGQAVRNSVIQTSDRRSVIRFQNLNAVRGWASLGLSWDPDSADAPSGGAITGIIFTTRATADPEFDNGQLTELQKRTPVEPGEPEPIGG